MISDKWSFAPCERVIDNQGLIIEANQIIVLIWFAC